MRVGINRAAWTNEAEEEWDETIFHGPHGPVGTCVLWPLDRGPGLRPNGVQTNE